MKSRYIAIFGGLAIVLTAFAVGICAAPGTSEDPVVSLSYLEQRIEQINKYVDEKIGEIAPGYVASTNTFLVVDVPAGKELLASAGTEMILRQGRATIFSTPKGGIANTTEGVDLSDGTPCPANSLLIVPLDDGRGLKAETDLLVMVKGKYTIK